MTLRIPISRMSEDQMISTLPPAPHAHEMADVVGLARELNKVETTHTLHRRRLEHLEAGFKGLVISQTVTGLVLAVLVLHEFGVL